MHINKSQSALFGSANQSARNQTVYDQNTRNGQKSLCTGQNANILGGVNRSGNNAAGGDLRGIKRFLSQNGQKGQVAMAYGSVADQSMSYADSLRASRMKAQETSLEVKKVKYNFKLLSAQILRSKTSSSAKQVASAARREVLKLKRQRQSGEYDSEELDSAIAHAQAMERAAKKKAAHLLEEEMVKVTGGPCAAEQEEREDQENAGKNEALEDAIAEYSGSSSPDREWDMTGIGQDVIQEQMKSFQEEMAARMEELQWAMEEMMMELQAEFDDPTEDMMSELMDDMSESMKEMLENTGLEDLADTMFATAETEVDPADYKMMKIKHRSEEMKAITKADAEYLKSLFDRLEKMKGSGTSVPMSGAGSAISMPSSGGAMPMPQVTVIAEPSAPEAGGIDISL